MAAIVEGGIKENKGLERFSAANGDVTPKDSIDLMARCWFSLTPGRSEPIEHSYVDARSGETETIRISAGAEHGIATIHDQDLLIFAISQWIDSKRRGSLPSRRVHFTPYQFFTWMNKSPGGAQYQRLRDCLQRLRTTTIETTIRSEKGKRLRNRVRQFSWISEWEIAEENGEIRGIEIVLAEWLFESVQDFHVLTLDKRYFDIPGSVERWIYLYARKATGGPTGIWRESFKSLYQKSASQQEYKHYASSIRKLIQKNNLPGLRLAQVRSVKGKDMLLMERTEKKQQIVSTPAPEVTPPEVQSVLIERSPIEEAWENVLETMRKRHGADVVKAWLEPLQLIGPEGDILRVRAKSRFVGEHVTTRYEFELRNLLTESGQQFRRLVIVHGAAKAAVSADA